MTDSSDGNIGQFQNEEESNTSNKEEPSNPLIIAEKLRLSLLNVDVDSHKEELVSKIKDMFIASRMESASLQEQLRATAIVNLLSRVQKNEVSVSQLMRIIEMTGSSGREDLSSLLGGGNKNGPLININNGNVSGGQVPQLEHKNTSGNPIQNAGHLLNAINSIIHKLTNDPKAQEKAGEIIDVTPERVENNEENND